MLLEEELGRASSGVPFGAWGRLVATRSRTPSPPPQPGMQESFCLFLNPGMPRIVQLLMARGVRASSVRGSVVFALLGWLLLAGDSAAEAKGGSLQFDRQYYAPGDTVTARAKAWIPRGETFQDEGPYDAYLLPSQPYIPPPQVPDNAFSVGTVDVNESPPGEGFVVPHFKFVVPEVPPGRYSVWLFDSQQRAIAIGDVSGGYLRIVRTSDQAARREVASWESRLRALRARMIARTEGLHRATEQMKYFRRERRELMAENDWLKRRLSQAEVRLQLPRQEVDAPPGPSFPWGWGVVGVLAASVTLALAARNQLHPAG
jgi:hypothetical protein